MDSESQTTDAHPQYFSVPLLPKLPNISATVSKADPYREHEAATTTPQPSSHFIHYLAASTFVVDQLKDVSSKVVQIPSSPTEVFQPSPSHSSVMNEDKHTYIQTMEDLEPSYVGQWDDISPSDWIWEKTVSLSETPGLSTEFTEIPVTSYFGEAHDLEPHVTPHSSTTYLSDNPVTVQYDSTYVDKLHRVTLGIPYSAKLPQMSHFVPSHTKADVTQQLTDTKSIHVPLATHSSASLFAEITKICKIPYKISPETPTVGATHHSDNPDTSIINITKLPKTSHFIIEHMSKSVLDLLNVESHLVKPTLVPPLPSNKTDTSPTNITAISEDKKSVFTTDRYATNSTIVPPRVSLLQFVSLPDEKIPASQGKTFDLKPLALLPPTKSMTKDLDSQTDTKPQEKSKVLQPVSLSTKSSKYNVQIVRPESAFLGFHINVPDGNYSTNVTSAKETLRGTSPQKKTHVLGQERVTKGTLSSSHPQVSAKPKFLDISLQIPEKGKEIDNKGFFFSKTLPTEGYKSKNLYTKVTGWIDYWLANHSLHGSGQENKISTISITSTASPYKSSTTAQVKGFQLTDQPDIRQGPWILSLPYSPTDNLHPSPDALDIKSTKMTTTGQDKSTATSNANNDHFDVNQEEAEQPSNDVFNISRNQTELLFPHYPGDSLFKITAEIQHQHVRLKEWQNELAEVARTKITEKMTYIPSDVIYLILKNITMTNPKNLTLTFWLHLRLGGKGMGNFIRNQVKTLEGQLIGTVGATLVSLSVKDVNECQFGIQNCDAKAQCANEFGSYSCQCINGYEDHPPAGPGTVCITPQPAEIFSISDHLEVLVATIGGVAITLLLAILLLCIVQLRRRSKANFILPERSRGNPGGHSMGTLGAAQGECGQMIPSLTRHMSPRQRQEQHTARDTSSTLELTNITFEQTIC
ncbi:uncharacterized protein [Pyxicephalus adspersus]|uniref:uncharacterized protein n=1 Tax=Pyxicephalus adspersus TaxID=30357 RepID=UPI003B5A0C14